MTKGRCAYCGTPCWRVCYIGYRLACVPCFDRLAVQPVLKAAK